jgi:hypothetical protein
MQIRDKNTIILRNKRGSKANEEKREKNKESRIRKNNDFNYLVN